MLLSFAEKSTDHWPLTHTHAQTATLTSGGNYITMMTCFCAANPWKSLGSYYKNGSCSVFDNSHDHDTIQHNSHRHVADWQVIRMRNHAHTENTHAQLTDIWNFGHENIFYDICQTSHRHKNWPHFCDAIIFRHNFIIWYRLFACNSERIEVVVEIVEDCPLFFMHSSFNLQKFSDPFNCDDSPKMREPFHCGCARRQFFHDCHESNSYEGTRKKCYRPEDEQFKLL